MNIKMKSFLLEKSISIPQESLHKKFYDSRLDFNLSFFNGEVKPTVFFHNNITTQSKTFAAPGDDDPDREAEICF